MKYTYKVTGMTCNGCKTSVEDNLHKINGIDFVSVDLQTETVLVVSENPISIPVLQEALPQKFTIFPDIDQTKEVLIETKVQKNDLQQLKPLFLIFAYLIVASILMNRIPWNTNSFMLDFMGLFYIVFSFFKFLDLKGFPESFKMYDPLAKAIPVYGVIYPFIELALGILLLMRLQVNIALLATIVILGITTIGVTKTLLDKKSIQCACLGTALKLPMTKATFIENSIMLVMAVIMLIKTIN